MADHEQDEEYLHQAANALKAIEEGTATAFGPVKYALKGRAVIEKWFELLGRIYTITPYSAVFLFSLVIVVYGVFCIGFVYADTEADLNTLALRVDFKEDADYTNRFVGTPGTLEVVLQYRPQPDLNTTNFTNSLLDHLRLVRTAIDLPVTYKGRTYTFRDLCAYFPFPPSGMPDFDRIMNTLHTCPIFTILDCYWEGSILQNPPESVVVARPTYCPEMPENLTWSNFNYTQFVECMRNNPNESNYDPLFIQGFNGLSVEGYVGKNCFSREGCPESSEYVEADSNLFRNVSICKGVNNGAITPTEIVAGYQGNDNTMDQLRAFRTDMFLGGADIVRNNLLYNGINISHIDTLGLLERWKEVYYEYVIDYNEGRIVPFQNRTSRDLMYGFTSITIQGLVDDVSVVVPALLITGYVLMILYCAGAFFKCDPMQSRCGVGLVGVFLVMLGTGAALGLTAYAGIKFSLITTQIYPFLVLGLGVDDMFVIVGTFLEIEQAKGRNAPIKDLIKDTMIAVGPSITLTSVTNFAGFLMCYIIPYDLFRNFVVEVAIAIVLNYIGLAIGMPCYLIIDHYRSHGKLMDVLCCVPVWWRKEKDDADKEVDEKKEEPGKSGHVSSWISQATEEYNSVLTWFVVKYYSPFLQNYIVKAVATTGFCILLAVGIWGCTTVTYDISSIDFSKDGSVYLEYAEIDDKYFRTFPFSLVTKQINYPGLQPQLLEMERRVLNLSNVLAPTNNNRLWLRVMIEFFQTLNGAVCQINDPGVQGLVTGIISAIDPMYFESETSCVPVAPPPLQFSQECLCKYNLLTVEEFRGREFTVIPRDKFYYYLTIWATLDQINLQLLQSFLSPAPLNFNPQDILTLQQSEPLLYVQTNLYVDGVRTSDIAVRHIEDIEGILEDLGIDGYNIGEAIGNYSQFLSLSDDIILAAAIIAICCFVVTTIFLMDIHSGVIMGGILVVDGVMVYGFIGHFNIDVNFFAATVFLAGIALGVEFTAPLALYFLKATAEADKTVSKSWWLTKHNERMHKALEHRFTAIFNGSVTTFVGVAILFFAPVRFLRVYFFGVLMIVVVVGVLNGLLFLPVLLSLIGPFPQVSPIDTRPPMVAQNPITEEELKDEELKDKEASTAFTY